MQPPRTIEDIEKRVPVDPQVLVDRLEKDLKKVETPEAKGYIERLKKALERGKFAYRERLKV